MLKTKVKEKIIMVCRNCGTQYDDRFVACPRCGAPKNVQVVYQQPVAPQPAPTPQDSNGMGVAGFVLGLLGFLSAGMSFILQLLGLIFSCVGVSKAQKLNGKNKGLSIAGLVLSILSFIPAILIILFVIVGVGGSIAYM